MKRLLLLVMFLFSLPVFAQERLEVITLKHRQAQEVIPLVQPFISKQGAISGMNDQLIIRESDRNLAEIRKVLEQLDREPRRLKITVYQGESLSDLNQGGRVSGRISTEGVNLGARIYSTERANSGGSQHYLLVVEGGRAFIQTGEAEPVSSTTVVQGPYGASVIGTTQYRETANGFYVVPRVNSDRVTLELSPSREESLDEGGRVARIDTTVSGRLGEWIDLGGAAQQQSTSESGLGTKSVHTRSGSLKTWVKVEEQP